MSRRAGGFTNNLVVISSEDRPSLKVGQDSDDVVRSLHGRDMVLIMRGQPVAGSGSS